MDMWSILLVLACCALDLVSGARFELYYSRKATWDEAKDLCMEKDRIFARVDSDIDQRWVETLAPYMSGFFWIGLKGNPTTGQFTWANSTPVDYTNWAEGFPGTAPGETCVRMRDFDFKWETFNCTAPLQYLCEDSYFRDSYTVTSETKIRGLAFGFGLIGGILILCCLMLQLPCCRTSVTQRIANFGFGTKSPDHKSFVKG